MRIISGEFRRRLLETPPDAEVTRPMPDRVRESLFAMFRGHCENATVFDGFAGTGVIGLEALSRGAAKCVFVEKNRDIAALLTRNVQALGCEDRAEIICGDVLGVGALARCPRPLTLAFLDPPYPMVRDAIGFQRVMAQLESLISLLTDDGFAVLRTPHPLLLSTPVVADELEPPPMVKHRKKKKEGKWRFDPLNPMVHPDGRQPDAQDRGDEELDDLELGDLAEADGDAEKPLPPTSSEGEVAPPPPGPIAVPADFTIASAQGPETHVYHNMAIHLYMRKR